VNSQTKVLALSMSLLMSAGLASPAFAQMEAGDWSVSLSGGGSFAIGGTMHGGANAPVANLGALNPALDGIPATLQVQERSQNDVYDTGWSIGGEIGYAVSSSGEILLGVRYLEANGNRINVGSAAAGAPVNASLPIFGNFGDYKALSIEVGYRQYLSSAMIKPFIAARAGTTRVSDIAADFTVPDAGIALNKVPFSDSSWVFSGGAALGVSVPLGDKVSIEPEVGIHYTDGAKGNDSALGGLGLGGINDAGERWSVPVSVRLKIAL
jgi:hypothetical protein